MPVRLENHFYRLQRRLTEFTLQETHYSRHGGCGGLCERVRTRPAQACEVEGAEGRHSKSQRSKHLPVPLDMIAI